MNRNKRRQFVTSSIITGSAVTALPNKWLKPLISTVMLPAHAQTSIINNSASVAPFTSSDEAESCNPAASSPTEFMFTGSSQEFIVPTGVTSLNINAAGGDGGGGGGTTRNDYGVGTGGTGSMGERKTDSIAVTPCETLRVVVGGGGGGGGGPAGLYLSYVTKDVLIPGGSGGYSTGVAGESGYDSYEGDHGEVAGGGGSGGNSIIYRGSMKLVESLGGTGGGGVGQGKLGGDGAGGGTGGYGYGHQGGNGGAGYNGSNGTGTGGAGGINGMAGIPGTAAGNGANGADGSITFTF